MPENVASELSATAAPDILRAWITKAPQCVEVRPVSFADVARITDDLDLGERAVIALAETVHADLLLIDEVAGRTEAKRRQLRVTGTLGESTSFYLDEALVRTVFAQWLPRS